MSKVKMTFLTEEQCIGEKKLDILKKYGIECGITDFAILSGGFALEKTYTTDEGNLENCCGWLTQTKADICGVITMSDSSGWCYSHDNFCSIRPVLRYSKISNKLLSKVKYENGILEVEYGEYPQTIVNENFSELLEKAYLNKKINQTGKTYTTNKTDFEIYKESHLKKSNILNMNIKEKSTFVLSVMIEVLRGYYQTIG